MPGWRSPLLAFILLKGREKRSTETSRSTPRIPAPRPSAVTTTPTRVGSMKRQHAKTWQHSIRAFLRLSRQILFSALLCFTIWTASPDAYATSPKTTSPAVPIPPKTADCSCLTGGENANHCS